MLYTITLNPAVDRELTVPEIIYDAVLRATEARVDFGGKGFNVSRILMGLGVRSTAMGFMGGRAGELLRDGLEGLGILTDFVWVAGETRTNVSIVTQNNEKYIKVNERGPLVDKEKQQELLDRIDAVAQPGDWWVLAGSLPPGVDAGYYAELTRVINQHAGKVILDTSGKALGSGLVEKPFLVKPNAEEAHQVTGLPVETIEDIKAVAQELRARGTENIVISMGKKGALLQTTEGTWMTHSPKIKEMNPIGAGDSMVGGLVYGLSLGKSLKEALGWGVASGAATASLPGTQVGSLALIQSLLDQVVFEKL